MTDRITEHYQENPEGARLVSDDELRSGQPRGSVSSRKKTESAAGSGKADKASKASKSSKSAKSGKAVKSAESSGVKGGAEKKTAAPNKKTAEKSGKPAKSEKKSAGIIPEPDESGEQSQSVKTPSVMRLVEERAFSENQVVAAGKSLIPRQLRGIEPLSKVMRREAELSESAKPAQPSQPSEADDEVSRSPLVMRELTGMVIAECVPGILKRFNACDCEKCTSELARLTAEEIPARYMKIPELADLSWSGFSDDERLLIDSLKKNAVTVMIRLMIANKKRNFHC